MSSNNNKYEQQLYVCPFHCGRPLELQHRRIVPHIGTASSAKSPLMRPVRLRLMWPKSRTEREKAGRACEGDKILHKGRATISLFWLFALLGAVVAEGQEQSACTTKNTFVLHKMYESNFYFFRFFSGSKMLATRVFMSSCDLGSQVKTLPAFNRSHVLIFGNHYASPCSVHYTYICISHDHSVSVSVDTVPIVTS